MGQELLTKETKACTTEELEQIVKYLEASKGIDSRSSWAIITRAVSKASAECDPIRRKGGAKRVMLYTLRKMLQNPNFDKDLENLGRVLATNSIARIDTREGQEVIINAIASQFIYRDQNNRPQSMQGWIWSLSYFCANKFRALYVGMSKLTEQVREVVAEIKEEVKEVINTVVDKVKKVFGDSKEEKEINSEPPKDLGNDPGNHKRDFVESVCEKSYRYVTKMVDGMSYDFAEEY